MLRYCITTAPGSVTYDETMPPRVSLKVPLKRPFIRERRKAENKSLDQMVALMEELVDGISKSTLSRIETGNQPYSQPILEALAFCLGCEPGDLLRPPPRPPTDLEKFVAALDAKKAKRALAILKTALAEDEAA